MLQHVHNFKVDVIAGDASAAAYKYIKKQQYQDLYNSSGAVMFREMLREVNTRRPFESRLHIDYYTNNHFSQLSSASDLACCLLAILSRGKPPGPRIMREFWSNSRVRIQGNEKRRGEDSSHSKCIEVLLTETAEKGYPDPENVGDPMIIALQNRDLWIPPIDLSWHFPVFVTIREMPFKNYRARSPAKLKVREDKTEEAKKQKIPKKK